MQLPVRQPFPYAFSPLMTTRKVSVADVVAAAASGAAVGATPPTAPAKKLPPKPSFPALRPAGSDLGLKSQYRRVQVPPNRMTPLKTQWMELYEPVVSQLKLNIRMNLKAKAVELKNGPQTTDTGALQKGADFIKAFMLGFAIRDAIALVRLDDLYLETFCVNDIRQTLKGDHVARAIGRLAGSGGKTKYTIGMWQQSCHCFATVLMRLIF